VSATEDLVRRMYAAYNSRDAAGLLALVTDDVDWPDGPARLHGKDALRDYWLRQWTRVHTHDEPGEPVDLDGGRITVPVAQTVRTPDGSLVSTGRFRHVFHIRDGLAVRLDIEGDDTGRP
jgi:ketosteroid isomerase-like protein